MRTWMPASVPRRRVPHRIERSVEMIKAPFVALIGVGALVAGLAAHADTTAPASQTPARPAQQPAGRPAVTYAVDVSLVEVDAVVTDGDGRVIRDLRPEDFR